MARLTLQRRTVTSTATFIICVDPLVQIARRDWLWRKRCVFGTLLPDLIVRQVTIVVASLRCLSCPKRSTENCLRELPEGRVPERGRQLPLLCWLQASLPAHFAVPSPRWVVSPEASIHKTRRDATRPCMRVALIGFCVPGLVYR